MTVVFSKSSASESTRKFGPGNFLVTRRTSRTPNWAKSWVKLEHARRQGLQIQCSFSLKSVLTNKIPCHEAARAWPTSITLLTVRIKNKTEKQASPNKLNFQLKLKTKRFLHWNVRITRLPKSHETLDTDTVFLHYAGFLFSDPMKQYCSLFLWKGNVVKEGWCICWRSRSEITSEITRNTKLNDWNLHFAELPKISPKTC